MEIVSTEDAVLESCAAAYISNRATTEKDEEPDLDLRVLEVMKSNYRPIGKTYHDNTR